MKIIVGAYACRPGEGSEPGIGWNWVRELSRFARLHVLTVEESREPVLRELARNPLPNVEWVFIPCVGGLSEGNRFQYLAWQRRIEPIARDLHDRIGFDVAHHLTWGAHWLPSGLATLGIPFTWGPVGGAERAPPVLARTLPISGRIEHAVRQVAQRFFEKNRAVRDTARRATIALAKTEDSAIRMRSLGSTNVRVFPAESLASADLDRLTAIAPRLEGPIRFISIGRLLHWKGFDLGIEAFAKIAGEFPAAEYWIAGSGREMDRLKRLAQKRGVADRVTFLGQRPRDSVLGSLAECDVLVHPSLHDSGGLVTLEAMMAGRPVVCLDGGGPGLHVNETNGFKIPYAPRPRVIADLSDAMRILCQDRDALVRMGGNGRAMVSRDFCGAALGSRIEALYAEFAVPQLG